MRIILSADVLRHSLRMYYCVDTVTPNGSDYQKALLLLRMALR